MRNFVVTIEDKRGLRAVHIVEAIHRSIAIEIEEAQGYTVIQCYERS